MSLNKEFHDRVHTLMMEILPYMDYQGAQRVERILHKWFRKNFEVYSMKQSVRDDITKRADFTKFKEHILANMSSKLGKSILETSGFSTEKLEKGAELYQPDFYPTDYYKGHLEIGCSVLAMRREPKK